MDKFYTRLGWMLAGTLLVSLVIALSGVKGERAFLLLYIAQLPMYGVMALRWVEKVLGESPLR